MAKESKKLLTVEHLTVTFNKENKVVDDISFSLEEGEILGIVGESGSGKSMTALSIMGLLHKSATLEGSMMFGDKNLMSITKEQYRVLKGKEMSMVFQEPMTSFNPLLTIGQQYEEIFTIHDKNKRKENKETIYEALRSVGLQEVERIYEQYPHQLSGGMRQRAMIGMAMLLKPKLLIADEPTTALDVTVQKKILELMKELNSTYGTSIILISHDLGVVHSICDRMIVMQHGKIVEQGTANEVFHSPRESYTKTLLDAIPKKVKKWEDTSVITRRKERESSNDLILEVEHLNVYYQEKGRNLWKKSRNKQVVYDANFTLREGESLGIVGESGSGKSTLAKAIVGLNPMIEGKIIKKHYKPQMVFQDPYSSLNPTKKVKTILEEPLILGKVKDKNLRKEKVASILVEVGLSKEYGERYIHQLSGGQRQRVAIGVALIQNSKFIVLDEPVSALDVTVQAQVLNLLISLQKKYNIAYLFISHDLNIVYQMCSRVCVMYHGQIVEYGSTQEIFDSPKENYTKELLESVLNV